MGDFIATTILVIMMLFVIDQLPENNKKSKKKWLWINILYIKQIMVNDIYYKINGKYKSKI